MNMNKLLYQSFFFLFQKLKNEYLFLLSFFAFLTLYSPILFSDSHISQNQTGIPDYTCQVNYKCLDYLNNVLLKLITLIGIGFLMKKMNVTFLHLLNNFIRQPKA